MQNRDHFPCSRVSQEQNDKRVQSRPSQFQRQRVQRRRQSARETTNPGEDSTYFFAKLSPELDAVETLEVWLSIALPEVLPGTVKRLRAGKGVENKTTVVQCVRENHSEPDEKTQH